MPVITRCLIGFDPSHVHYYEFDDEHPQTRRCHQTEVITQKYDMKMDSYSSGRTSALFALILKKVIIH